MFGAAWSTLLAFFFMAMATAVIAQSNYPVPYEYGRLAKLVAAAVIVYIAAQTLNPATLALAIAWRLALALLIFPLLLLATGFFGRDERTLLDNLVRRWLPSLVQK